MPQDTFTEAHDSQIETSLYDALPDSYSGQFQLKKYMEITSISQKGRISQRFDERRETLLGNVFATEKSQCPVLCHRPIVQEH